MFNVLPKLCCWLMLLLATINVVKSASVHLTVYLDEYQGDDGQERRLNAPKLNVKRAEVNMISERDFSDIEMVYIDLQHPNDMGKTSLKYNSRSVTDSLWNGSEIDNVGSASFRLSHKHDKNAMYGWFTVGGLNGQVGTVGQSPDGETWVRMESIADLPPTTTIEYPESDDRGRSARGGDKGIQIDIMVPYTSDALCSAAGLESGCETSGNEAPIKELVEFFVEENNAIFYATGLKTEFRLVHSYMISGYEEGKSFTVTLDEMLEKDDGVFESMHDLRNEYCADIVHLIVADGDTSIPDGIVYGQASALGAKRKRWAAVSALEVGAIASATFSHENGHLLGGRHFHGFVDSDVTYGTLMVTLTSCPLGTCERLPVFSSARGKYESYDSVGNRIRSNNKKKIKDNQRSVAKLKNSRKCRNSSSTSSSTKSSNSQCLTKEKRKCKDQARKSTFVGLVNKSKLNECMEDASSLCK